MDRFIEYRGVRIGYRVSGESAKSHESEGKKCLLFLHGWGGDDRSFASVEQFFAVNYYCIFVCLPCFQKTDANAPDITFTLGDYAAAVLAVLDFEGVERTLIIAHSFGARVSVLLAGAQPMRFTKLLLTGAAGIPRRRSFILRCKIWWYKLRRKLFKIKTTNKGSSDYRALTDAGKLTFKNILQSDLRLAIADLKVPTLLIFGDRDRATPIYMAKLWTKLSACTRLIIYRNAGHFCFLDEPSKFIIDAQFFFSDGDLNCIAEPLPDTGETNV